MNQKTKSVTKPQQNSKKSTKELKELIEQLVQKDMKVVAGALIVCDGGL